MAAEEKSTGLVRGLGPIGAVALVAGNIIGSGIYVVPGQLAKDLGPAALLAWVLTAAAYFCLLCVFADLGGAYPISGGPQTFVQRAFGQVAGFQASFLYWLSAVIGNAAFATGFVGYLAVFFPEVGGGFPAFVAGQALLWTFTGINLLGVAAGGLVQIVATVLKIVPLFVLSAALLMQADTGYLQGVVPEKFGPVLLAMPLIAWLFLGAESVTIPAEEIRGEGKTIRMAAYIGFGLATLVYLLVAVALVLGLPSETIAGSSSPLAVAAEATMGRWGGAFVTVAALISIAGVMNGWLLVAGRLPYTAARDGLVPKALGRLHPRTGAPIPALLLSSSISGLMLLQYFNQTLLGAYNFIATASTATALVAIGACCVAQIVLMQREPERFTPWQRTRGPVTASVGLVAVGVLIYFSGWQVWLLTLGVIAVGLAVYFLQEQTP